MVRVSRRARLTAIVGVLSTVVAGATAASLALAPGAAAGTGPGPIMQDGANHATADALPTAQIDGVVWSQAIVGDTVYAGGNFGHARPAGSASGVNTVVRTDAMAYTLSTGAMTSWAPVLNGQVLAVAVSPDHSRVYLGGQFSSASGATHNRIAAYSTSTGAIISTFAPALNATVYALTVTNSTVYVGGSFTSANGQTRTRLAAFSASNGALTTWAPTADQTVEAMVLTPDGTEVIVGGHFQLINSTAVVGLAALTATTGTNVAWAASKIIKDAGPDSAITSLTTDGTAIYGTGYKFQGNIGNLEGAFSASPNSGALNWVEDCHGDTYGAFSTGSVVYSVSHSHFCGNDGSFPETTPTRSYHHALSWTANATGTLLHNPIVKYFDWSGTPAPSQYNWYPDLTNGSFTGQNQAAWSVTGNSQYIVLGGEFPSVNLTPQQGLVRFAVPSIAPNKSSPRLTSATFIPRFDAMSTTSLRISWGANWDRDDTTLTYKLIRNDASTTPIYTTSLTAPFWLLPTMTFTDTGLTPGQTYKYKVYATDSTGNTDQGTDVSVTMPTSNQLSAYALRVINDGAFDYWRLGETSGTKAIDSAGTSDMTEGSTVSHGVAGAIVGDSNAASGFNGANTGAAQASTFAPPLDNLTIEAWFKTTAKTGGKIVGMGNDNTTKPSTNVDRQIYLDNAGHVIFGVATSPTAKHAVISSTTYSDGAWHQAVATLSSAGMVLYVDGVSVGTNASVTAGQELWGYWRIGGDSLAGWPNVPTKQYIVGSIDEVALYPTALSAAQVAQHYTLSGH